MIKLLPKSTYTYQDLTELGYKEVKLSRKELESFSSIKAKKSEKYVLFFRYDGAYLHTYYALWVKVAVILLFPVSLLYEGLGNAKEVYRDAIRVLMQRKYGSFRADHISPNTSYWVKIKDIVKKKT